MTGKRKRAKINRDLPPVGTNLHGAYKKKSYKAKIVKDKSQKTGRAVEYNEKLYSSMTAAAKAITKQSTNGWQFWKF